MQCYHYFSDATFSGATNEMKLSPARFAYIFAFLVVAGYAFFTLRGPTGVPALLEKRRQIDVMEKRNEALTQEIQREREHIQRLSNNPEEQELEIRQRLKLVHPGDKVYILSK
ncbi:MAG: septum formation initiator family protein [Acidobacteriia bacterium]|nr:septum formation initiator family protein [Terriglobia bacterium]